MDAAESVLRAGYRLDRYELLCPIASGGMATVWLARLRGKRGFEKLYAIKTIRTELVEDSRFQEMFLDEARIASGIQHPNVAQILDLGEQADVLFIVMEWVDGDSLAKIRKLVSKAGHTVPVGVVLRILADASAGLHAAHELKDDQGHPLEVVHRDVSPQNILVSTSGAVKIIDFGIAKAQNRQQGSTRTGIVKGKIQYMAPEQVKKGRTVDRRADIWALGVTLHELVTGKLPYDGEDDVEVIRCLMAEEPPIVAPETPDAIVRVLSRSMVLDPDARFPTAAGMQRGLEAAMKELGETTTSEDVAAFLRSELTDLANKRRDIVARAVDQARERGTPVNTAPDPDVAFAPTQMSERFTGPETHREGEASSFALTRRKDSANMRASAVPTLASEDSRLASSLDYEPIAIPKSSRAWLWALLLLLVSAGAGTAFMFPAEANRILVAIGLGHSDTVEPSSSPGTPAVPPGSQLTPPPASAVPPAAPATASAVSASSAVPAASLSARPPEPLHHTWPGVSAPAVSASASHGLHAAASASGAPPAPQPAASSSASQPAAPPAESAAPASSDEDPSNPYSVPRPSGAAPPL
jgi:serine/threonine-protein kinase